MLLKYLKTVVTSTIELILVESTDELKSQISYTWSDKYIIFI